MMIVTRCLYSALLAALLAFAACQGAEDPVVKRPGEPDVIRVDAGDANMNRAMARARETIGEFLKRLEHPPEAQTFIALKVRLEEGHTVEHVWLNSVSHANTLFAGVVGNEPVDLKKVRLGDRVSAPLARVSDWMAVERGRLIGGYTIRVLREGMTLDERRAFDKELSFIIE